MEQTWQNFIQLVSLTRLEVLLCLLAGTIILGVLSALKSHEFKWSQIAGFLVPGETAFWYILGYIAAAGLAASLIPDGADPTVIVTTYSVATAAIVLKVKEQIAFLWPWLPVANWKLPFEASATKAS